MIRARPALSSRVCERAGLVTRRFECPCVFSLVSGANREDASVDIASPRGPNRVSARASFASFSPSLHSTHRPCSVPPLPSTRHIFSESTGHVDASSEQDGSCSMANSSPTHSDQSTDQASLPRCRDQLLVPFRRPRIMSGKGKAASGNTSGSTSRSGKSRIPPLHSAALADPVQRPPCTSNSSRWAPVPRRTYRPPDPQGSLRSARRCWRSG